MDKIAVAIKRLKPAAIIPVYATEYSAGADIYACIDTDAVIEPGEAAKIPSGLAVELPRGYAGLVFARSGLSLKKGLAPANKVGVIDSDYRGEIFITLHNHSKQTAAVSPGERVAQLVIVPVMTAEFIEAESLCGTERGEGGFGSTGQW